MFQLEEVDAGEEEGVAEAVRSEKERKKGIYKDECTVMNSLECRNSVKMLEYEIFLLERCKSSILNILETKILIPPYPNPP